MTTAFISHATEDKYFVDLLVEILKYHHVDCWYDSEGISVGKKYKDEISDGLANAQNLIVIISENTQKSDWVKREIAQFHTLKPDAKIVPLLLGNVSPDAIYDGLKEYQSIFFYKNMLFGFRDLFKFFGKEFLPSVERRNVSERRDEERRGEDRRKHDVLQRLRHGLWKNYAEATGKGKFDLYEESVLSIGQFTRALLPVLSNNERDNSLELSRYDFFNKETGQKVKISSNLIDQYLYTVIEDLRREYRSYIKYVFIIEGLAEILTRTYDVRPKDKRVSDRRTKKDRRS